MRVSIPGLSADNPLFPHDGPHTAQDSMGLDLAWPATEIAHATQQEAKEGFGPSDSTVVLAPLLGYPRNLSISD